MNECKLKLFDIDKLGLFDYAHTPKVIGVNYFFNLLRQFIKDRTATNSRMSAGRKEAVYCYDIEQLVNGDYVVILWLGVTNNGSRKILSLPKNGVIGCDLKQARGDASGIIGIPAYFYISAETNSLVVMEFPGASGDSSLLTNYLSDFIHNFSGHGVQKDKEVILKADPSSDEDKACYFSFSIKKFTSKTIEEYLRMNFASISNVMMKDKITATETVTRDLGAVFNALRPWVRKTAGEVTKSSTVSISVPVSFASLDEIDQYIESVKGNGKQDAVGFKVTKKNLTDTSQNIYYLNGTQARKASLMDLGGKEWPYKANDLVSFFNENNKVREFIKSSHNPLSMSEHNSIADATFGSTVQLRSSGSGIGGANA